MNIAQVIPDTEAEGPGRRFAVWVQGCPFRCPGCCNPQMLKSTSPSAAHTNTDDLVRQALNQPGIEGVSILGGEPFAQASDCAEFASIVRDQGLSVMVYTGYTLAELQLSDDPAVYRLLASIDLLVDGRYDKSLPETERRWIGSSNQVLHFLTDRYDPSDPRFTRPNTVELRLTKRSLTVNGFPAKGL